MRRQGNPWHAASGPLRRRGAAAPFSVDRKRTVS